MYFIENNGYIIINQDNNNYLLDTGWPNSFMFERDVRFIDNNGNSHNILVNNDNRGVKESISMAIRDINIDGFIGMDIVSKTGLIINYENKQIFFNTIEGSCVACKINDELHTNDIIYNNINRRTTTYLDTGAPIGYLDDEIIGERKTSSRYVDYCAGGRLEGNYYSVDFKINNEQNTHKTCKFGKKQFPGQLLENDAVINLKEVLNKGQTLAINFRTKKIYELTEDEYREQVVESLPCSAIVLDE